jgi:Methyltransferase domain
VKLLVKAYSALAGVYSHLMRSIDYPGWADYIFDISSEIKKDRILALELAGGVGTLAKLLSTRFAGMIICDLSTGMLLQIENNECPRVCCDMSSLPFRKYFDFVYSAFDSVNYLLTKERFVNMLNSVSYCLNKEGIFTFDVSLEKNSLRYQRYLNRKGIYNKVKYIQKSRYNEKTRIHTNQFDITLKDGTSVREIHKQKIFSFEDYFRFIDDTDLYVHKCFVAFSRKDADEETERAQFILKKRYAKI